MDSIHSDYLSANQELSEYIKKNNKYKDRYESLLTDMNNFLNKNGLDEWAHVNEVILAYALIDYFEDVKRLKNFHNVDHINAIKIVSYVSYWLIRRKPIQILDNQKELVDINERFVLAYIIGFLNNSKGSLLDRHELGIESFKESLLYFLKFRFIKANTLEIMLIAFFAGQIYQEDTRDISSELSNIKLNSDQE